VLSLQTKSGDQAIDRLADGVALLAQVPVVLSGSNSQFAPPVWKTWNLNRSARTRANSP
jgi:hypothetical protein